MGRLIICPKYLWDGISKNAQENMALVIQDGIVKEIVKADTLAQTVPGGSGTDKVIRNDAWLLLPAFVDERAGSGA